MSALTKRLAELAGLAAVIVAIVLWVTSSLDGKTSTARADKTDDRVRTLELERRDDRRDLEWIKAGVAAIAQRVGAVIPPPTP